MHKHAPTSRSLPFKLLLAALAVTATGITMPSCPGQQAMQQQIEALQTENQSLRKQLKDIDGKLQGVTAIQTEFGQAKQLLSQMTDTIKEQQNAIAQMDAAVKALAARPAPAPARAAPPAKRPAAQPRRR